jgi:type I restriction enzyme S subunit
VNRCGNGVPYVSGPEQWAGDRLHLDKWTTSPKRLVPDGCIFITVKGAGVGTTFRGARCAIGRDIYAFEAAQGLDAKYLHLALDFDIRTLIAHAAGLIPGLSREHILQQAITLPPFAEQRRIVESVDALLTYVNAARARLEKASRLLKRFHQSVLAAACSGRLTEDFRNNLGGQPPQLPLEVPPSRRRRRGANLSGDGDLVIDAELPELPETWIYARADQIVARGTTITYGIVVPGPEVPGGVPYVRQLDIVAGGIQTEQLRHTSPEIAAKHPKSVLQDGDVLLCIIRNLRVAIVPPGIDGANITQGAVRLRPEPNLVLPDYLAAYLSSTYAQGWMRRRYFGMDMPRINVEDARAIPIAVPPIAEQWEIVRGMRALLNVLEKVEARLSVATRALQSISDAILVKAFRGELVATEAEVARADGRGYESAESLLSRIQSDRRA